MVENLITTNSAKRPISEIFNWKDLKALPGKWKETLLKQTKQEIEEDAALNGAKKVLNSKLSKQKKPNEKPSVLRYLKSLWDYQQESN